MLVLVIPVGLLPTCLLAASLCEQPLGSGTPTRFPAWLTRIKERDDVAFPAHALLGTMLHTARCHAAASGLQWLKAAAHARSAAEIERSAAGMRSSAACLGSVSALAAQLCPFVKGGFANPRQSQAAAQAGLACSLP